MTCDSKDTCIRCKDGLKKNEEEGTCGCETGYFLVGDECRPCEYPCLDCEKSANNCKSCASTTNRRDPEDGCGCKDGYWDNEENKRCDTCYFGCKSCTGPSTCNSCHDNRDIENNCECFEGYLSSPSVPYCYKTDIATFDPNGSDEQKKSRCLSIGMS